MNQFFRKMGLVSAILAFTLLTGCAGSGGSTSGTTDDGGTTTYNPVTSVTASGGNGSVSVTWAAPSGSTPSNYKVEVYDALNNLVKIYTTADASTLSYVYNSSEGALENNDYSFKVYARYSDGTFSSAVVSGVVNSGVVPTTAPDPISTKNVDVSTVVGTAKLTWTKPTNAESVTIWRVAAGTGNSIDPAT